MSLLYFNFLASLFTISYIASSYKLCNNLRTIITNNGLTLIKYDDNKKTNFHTNTCLFARYNGKADSKSNKDQRTSNENHVKLLHQEDSRSLNQPELKARDKYAGIISLRSLLSSFSLI